MTISGSCALRIVAFALLAIPPGLAFSAIEQGDEMLPRLTVPNEVAVDYARDQAGSHSYGVVLNHVLHRDHRVLADFTSTRLNAASAPVDAQLYHVGLRSSPLDEFALGFGFEQWDVAEILKTQTTYGLIEWTRPQWALIVKPFMRLINHKNMAMDAMTMTEGFASYNFSLDSELQIYFVNQIRASISYAYYDYDRDPSHLNTGEQLFSILFSPSNLKLTQGFEDSRWSAGVTYFFAMGQTSIDWSQRTSAVDRSKFTNVSVSAKYQFASNWTLRGIAGQSLDGEKTDLLFGSLGLIYQWH